MIHKHWCRVCSARIEAGDGGVCGSELCRASARREAMGEEACSKESALYAMKLVQGRYATGSAKGIVHQKLIEELQAHPYDDATDFYRRHVAVMRTGEDPGPASPHLKRSSSKPAPTLEHSGGASADNPADPRYVDARIQPDTRSECAFNTAIAMLDVVEGEALDRLGAIYNLSRRDACDDSLPDVDDIYRGALKAHVKKLRAAYQTATFPAKWI